MGNLHDLPNFPCFGGFSQLLWGGRGGIWTMNISDSRSHSHNDFGWGGGEGLDPPSRCKAQGDHPPLSFVKKLGGVVILG